MLFTSMKRFKIDPPPEVDYHAVELIWITHIGQGDFYPAPERLICAVHIMHGLRSHHLRTKVTVSVWTETSGSAALSAAMETSVISSQPWRFTYFS